MSVRKVLVDLGKVVTRVSFKPKSSRPTVDRLFTTEKPEIKNKADTSAPTQRLTEDRTFQRNEPSNHNGIVNQHSIKGELSREEIVLKNMKNGRFSTRFIASLQGTYTRCSVAGSEILITSFVEGERFGSYCGGFVVIGHELVNAETGARQQIKLRDRQNILTPSYIVTMVGTSLVVIQSRSTNTKATVPLPITSAVGTPDAQLISNNIVDCEKIMVMRDRQLFMIDLQTEECHEIHIPVIREKDQIVHDVQLCGSLIAYITYNKANMDDRTLRVVDNTGKELFRKEKLKLISEYYLLGDKVVVSDMAPPNITWSVIDMGSGNILKHGGFETNGGTPTRHVSVYKNFLIFNQSNVLHFVDYNSGKLLTSLSAHGLYGYDRIYGFGAGQFIVSIEQCIQLVDFESVESDQPVRVVVINPNDTVSTRRGTINEVIHGISFSNTTVPNDKVRPHSTIVHSTETERITFVHVKPSTMKDSPIVSRILKGRPKMENFTLRSAPKNLVVKFLGQGLLFKEELVDGEWRPVDFDVKQAEELIDSC